MKSCWKRNTLQTPYTSLNLKKKSKIGKNGKNGKDELPVRCTLYDIIFIKVTLHSDHFWQAKLSQAICLETTIILWKWHKNMMTTIESKPISHDKNKTKHSDSYKSANKALSWFSETQGGCWHDSKVWVVWVFHSVVPPVVWKMLAMPLESARSSNNRETIKLRLNPP